MVATSVGCVTYSYHPGRMQSILSFAASPAPAKYLVACLDTSSLLYLLTEHMKSRKQLTHLASNLPGDCPVSLQCLATRNLYT